MSSLLCICVCVCEGGEGTEVELVKNGWEECEDLDGFCQRFTSHAKPDVYVTPVVAVCSGGFLVGEGETGATP